MSLTDIMSAERLTMLPQAALLLFLIAFGAVCVRLCLPGRRRLDARCAALPLDDSSAPTSRASSDA